MSDQQPHDGDLTVGDQDVHLTRDAHLRSLTFAGKGQVHTHGFRLHVQGGLPSATIEIPTSPEPERPEWVKCVTRVPEGQEAPAETWCGRKVWVEWLFTGADHAEACIGKTWTQPCEACRAAYLAAVQGPSPTG
jgi:hypothetical protein